MARHSPLFHSPHPAESGTHPSLQEHLQNGLREAIPVQEVQEAACVSKRSLEALVDGTPRTAAVGALDSAAGR